MISSAKDVPSSTALVLRAETTVRDAALATVGAGWDEEVTVELRADEGDGGADTHVCVTLSFSNFSFAASRPSQHLSLVCLRLPHDEQTGTDFLSTGFPPRLRFVPGLSPSPGLSPEGDKPQDDVKVG